MNDTQKSKKYAVSKALSLGETNIMPLLNETNKMYLKKVLNKMMNSKFINNDDKKKLNDTFNITNLL